MVIDSSSLLTRLGWHATFWASTVSAFSILKLRLMSSWEERNRDSQAADVIVRHFQCSWDEGVLLRRTLLQDLHRKIDSLFPVEKLMSELDAVTGEASQVRNRKLAIWEELKIEGIQLAPNLTAT
jgi:hypothetical protein